MTLTENFRAALAVAVPIISIDTPDPQATMDALREAVKPKGDKRARPFLRWSSATGIEPLNAEGQEVAQKCNDNNDARAVTANPAEAVAALQQVPERTVTFMLGAHTIMSEPVVTQGIWELRDEYAAKGAMLVLLSPGLMLPPELANDVIALDEPLPNAQQLEGIAVRLMEAAELKANDHAADLEKSISALCGLAAFSAEQAFAMSLRPEGIDLDGLWDRKRRMIADTRALSVHTGSQTFSEIGGNENVKQFILGVLQGKRRPESIVFIDEIEKQFGGLLGETSGTTKDQLGQLLTEMDETDAVGILCLGPPGAGKSAVAKAAGKEAGILTMQLDLGGAKSSLVGSSEQLLRRALKVIRAVSNSRPLYIATCNSIVMLPPELRRRFSLGTFFFDLPSPEERKAIWDIYLRKFEIGTRRKQPMIPPDDGWTGAEIKNCCDIADRLEISLEDAADFVVPVAVSASAVIETLRRNADKAYLSASQPGLYRYGDIKPASPKGRKIKLKRDLPFPMAGGER